MRADGRDSEVVPLGGEGDGEGSFYIHRSTVLHGRMKLPLRHSLACELVKAAVDAVEDAAIAYRPIGADHGLECNYSFYVLPHQLQGISRISFSSRPRRRQFPFCIGTRTHV